MDEFFDVYDTERRPLGRVHKRGVELPPGERGVGAEVWIFSGDGRLLITRRHPKKSHGGEWDVPGGMLVAGETSVNGALREVFEETGISLLSNELTFIGTETRRYQFVDTYKTINNTDIASLALQSTEVTEAKWVDKTEFEHMLALREITHSVIDRYRLFHVELGF